MKPNLGKSKAKIKKMINITSIRIYPFDTSSIRGRIRAYADVEIDGVLLIKGFKIIEMDNGGLFINNPTQKARDGRFLELVVPLNKDVEKLLRDEIINEYKNLIK